MTTARTPSAWALMTKRLSKFGGGKAKRTSRWDCPQARQRGQPKSPTVKATSASACGSAKTGKELERSGAGRHLAADAKAFTVRVQPWRPASSVARCRRKVLLTGPAISSAVARDKSSTPVAIGVQPGASQLGRRPGVKGQPQSWAGVSPRQPGRRPGVKEIAAVVDRRKSGSARPEARNQRSASVVDWRKSGSAGPEAWSRRNSRSRGPA
jgi:hypothetical protein